jgi:hypothetical protein
MANRVGLRLTFSPVKIGICYEEIRGLMAFRKLAGRSRSLIFPQRFEIPQGPSNSSSGLADDAILGLEVNFLALHSESNLIVGIVLQVNVSWPRT